MVARQYIQQLMESGASAENPAVRPLMACCVEAIDRGALATYDREAANLTPSQLASILRALADHLEQHLPDALGQEWANRFRQDARDLEEHRTTGN